MLAREIMTPDPACCAADDTIKAAAQLMAQNDCGCIPVVDSDEEARVIGMITDRDIAVRGVARGNNPDTRVGDLMSPDPLCCSPDVNVDEIEKLMADHQVRRVAVVDNQGRCIGIIAQADLARAAETGNGLSEHEVGRVVAAISEPTNLH